jgi:hypothetical protein
VAAADNTAKAKKSTASTVTRSRTRAATSSPAARSTRATANKVAAAPATRQRASSQPAAGKSQAKPAPPSKARPVRKVTTVRIESEPARKKVAAARASTSRTRTSAKVATSPSAANGTPVFATSVLPAPRVSPTVSLNGHAPVDAARPRHRSPLWSSRQLLWWGGVVGASIIACFIAYIISAGKATLSGQAPSLNIAIFALVAAGAANVWLLVVGRRAIGLRRRALLGEPAATARRSAPVPAVVPTGPDDSFVADPALTLYHRSGCALAVGRRWAALPRAAHEGAGRTACGVCRP